MRSSGPGVTRARVNANTDAIHRITPAAPTITPGLRRYSVDPSIRPMKDGRCPAVTVKKTSAAAIASAPRTNRIQPNVSAVL
jgi:hypothetical protein